MTEGRTGIRLKILAVLVVVMFAALTTRLWFLQVLATERYRTEAKGNSVRFVKEAAPRGLIFDRNGNRLVENRTEIEVTVDRQKVTGRRREEMLQALSSLLHEPVPTLERRLSDPKYFPFTPVPVAFNVAEEVAFAIGEHPESFPGVDTQTVPGREYPYRDLAAHVLGYVGPISPEEIDLPAFSGYDPNDTLGRAGLEQQYESALRGTKGATKYTVDAQGDNLGELGHFDAESGNDVVTTLDVEIQQIAQDSLELGMQKAQDAGLKATSGAVVVLDPNTGGIVAVASEPTFNPSIYNGGLSGKEERELQLNKRHPPNPPLLNRAMAGEYPPGSTLKTFIALAALKEGMASFGSALPCDGTFKVPGDESGTVFHNWTTANLGPMNVQRALIYSCDTVFYQFGYDFWTKYHHDNGDNGPELLQRDLRAFGFGRASGIDLPFQEAGLVPDQEWKNATFEEDPRNFCANNWCPGDYILMSIGQGDMKVTPLQLGAAYSAIANGGKLCEPHLGLQIQKPGGHEIVEEVKPECSALKGFSSQQLNYVENALRQVPTSGTAAPAFVGFPFNQVSIAGKTGTAEVTGQHQPDSWFAAIAKGQEKGQSEQYVVVAIVERGGHGAETAAPIVRQVIEGIFGLHRSAFRLGAEND